jgi:hypothetical protein
MRLIRFIVRWAYNRLYPAPRWAGPQTRSMRYRKVGKREFIGPFEI